MSADGGRRVWLSIFALLLFSGAICVLFQVVTKVCSKETSSSGLLNELSANRKLSINGLLGSHDQDSARMVGSRKFPYCLAASYQNWIQWRAVFSRQRLQPSFLDPKHARTSVSVGLPFQLAERPLTGGASLRAQKAGILNSLPGLWFSDVTRHVPKSIRAVQSNLSQFSISHWHYHTYVATDSSGKVVVNTS